MDKLLLLTWLTTSARSCFDRLATISLTRLRSPSFTIRAVARAVPVL